MDIPPDDRPSPAERAARAGRSLLVERSDHFAPSVFQPESLLREARRQKGLALGSVPFVCLLDPDGDIVDLVRASRGARRSDYWACYHTHLWEWQEGAARFGVVGRAVGGAFAVLVAEQLFASGCGLVVSISSAGRISREVEPPAYVLIDRALRDEGTSHHYLPAAPAVSADPRLIGLAAAALATTPARIVRGTTWTTDAPFRETDAMIGTRCRQGVLIVEMEAASLLALAEATRRAVVCVAHVTNDLGQVEGDFEKGEGNGAALSLEVALAIARSCAAVRQDDADEREGVRDRVGAVIEQRARAAAEGEEA